MGTALSAELSWRGDGCPEVPGALSRLTERGDGGFFYMGREGSSRRSRSAHLESRGRCGDGYPTSDGPWTVDGLWTVDGKLLGGRVKVRSPHSTGPGIRYIIMGLARTGTNTQVHTPQEPQENLHYSAPDKAGSPWFTPPSWTAGSRA